MIEIFFTTTAPEFKGTNTGRAVAQILRDLADKSERGENEEGSQEGEFRVVDSEGNSIGYLTYTPDGS